MSHLESSGVLPLPPELWLHVATFLTDDELERLLGVSHLFYDIVMARRYREVRLVESNPRQFFRKINMLKDQAISSRIQTLKLWPDAVWKAISTTPIPQGQVILRGQAPPKKRKNSMISTFVNKCLRRHPGSSEPVFFTFTDPEELSMSVEDKTAVIAALSPTLINIKELHLKWDAVRPVTQNPCCPILDTLLPLMGSRLRSLTIDVPMARVDPFPALMAITNLEELAITISGVPQARRGLTAATRTAQLLNRFSSTLRTLSISSCDHFNISPLFNDLERFPLLTELRLCVPLNMLHVPDTSGINRLLCHHRNLEKLVIVDEFCCVVGPTFQTAISVSRYDQVFQGISFLALKEVELGLNFRLFFNNTQNQHNVQSLFRSVTSLSIARHCLSFAEAKGFLESLPDHLTTISLFLENLTLEVLDLFMQNCPNLKNLCLFANRISLDEESIREWYSQHKSQCSSWRLLDIDIWNWEYRIGQQHQWTLMRVLAECIPSIRSFARRGHMSVETDTLFTRVL